MYIYESVTHLRKCIPTATSVSAGLYVSIIYQKCYATLICIATHILSTLICIQETIISLSRSVWSLFVIQYKTIYFRIFNLQYLFICPSVSWLSLVKRMCNIRQFGLSLIYQKCYAPMVYS